MLCSACWFSARLCHFDITTVDANRWYHMILHLTTLLLSDASIWRYEREANYIAKDEGRFVRRYARLSFCVSTSI